MKNHNYSFFRNIPIMKQRNTVEVVKVFIFVVISYFFYIKIIFFPKVPFNILITFHFTIV